MSGDDLTHEAKTARTLAPEVRERASREDRRRKREPVEGEHEAENIGRESE